MLNFLPTSYLLWHLTECKLLDNINKILYGVLKRRKINNINKYLSITYHIFYLRSSKIFFSNVATSSCLKLEDFNNIKTAVLSFEDLFTQASWLRRMTWDVSFARFPWPVGWRSVQGPTRGRVGWLIRRSDGNVPRGSVGSSAPL